VEGIRLSVFQDSQAREDQQSLDLEERESLIGDWSFGLSEVGKEEEVVKNP
jgi:hypothetical protein